MEQPIDIKQKLIGFAALRAAATEALIMPARAAANAMKDAGMSNTAQPLLEALFKLDSITQEMAEFTADNSEQVMRIMFNMLEDK